MLSSNINYKVVANKIIIIKNNKNEVINVICIPDIENKWLIPFFL